MLWWWCVWCGVCVKLGTLSLSCSLLFSLSFLPLIFIFLSSFSFSFSLAPSLALALVISLFLLSPLLPTNQPTRRPTSRHLNVIWRRASALQSVPSLLPSPPPLLKNKKEEGTFYYRNISGEEFIFCYGFKLIPKTRRRGKLQSLQFYINSKTIGL